MSQATKKQRVSFHLSVAAQEEVGPKPNFPAIPQVIFLMIIEWVLALAVNDGYQAFKALLTNLTLVSPEWETLLESQSWFRNTIFLQPGVTISHMLDALHSTETNPINIQSRGLYDPFLASLAATQASRWRSWSFHNVFGPGQLMVDTFERGLPKLEDLKATVRAQAARQIIDALANHRPPSLHHIQLEGPIDVPLGIQSGSFRGLVSLVLKICYPSRTCPVDSAGIEMLLQCNPDLAQLEIFDGSRRRIKDSPVADLPPIRMKHLTRLVLLIAGCTPIRLQRRLYVPKCSRIRMYLSSEILKNLPTDEGAGAEPIPIIHQLCNLISQFSKVSLCCKRDSLRRERVWVLSDESVPIEDSKLQIIISDGTTWHPLDVILHLFRRVPQTTKLSIQAFGECDLRTAPSLLGLPHLRSLSLYIQHDRDWISLLEVSPEIPGVYLDHLQLCFKVGDSETFSEALYDKVVSQIADKDKAISTKLHVHHAEMVGFGGLGDATGTPLKLQDMLCAALRCKELTLESL